MARATPVRAQGREELTVLDLLGRLDERRLATLLTVRPDLADPPPKSLIELATRAVAPVSVEVCRLQLELAGHQVHCALCLLSGSATVAELAGLLSVDEDDPDLAHAVSALTDRAMVLRDGDRLSLLPGLELRFPAGLGPPVAVALASQSGPALTACAQRLGVIVTAGTTKAATLASMSEVLSDPGWLSRLLAKAPPGAADLVRRLAYDGPEGHAPGAIYNGDKTAAGWLVNRGVVAPVGWDTVLLVREVAIAIRGGKAFPGLGLRRPDLSTFPIDAAACDRTAAERALRLVADVSTILDGWAADPPRQLKAGGLGVQAVRRVAKAVDRSEVEAARVIELAAAAGLVSIDGGTDAVLPLPAYDDWSGLSAAARWSRLAAAWMEWDLHIGVAGALDGKGKPIPPLMVRAPEAYAIARRSRLLDALAELPPGTAVTSGSAYERLLWDAPALWAGGPGPPDVVVGWTLDECELFGLCGLGALSTWGRLAASGDRDGAEAALARTVPEATSHFVVQADLTALAPAELVRPVLAELESMASLESRGAAALYRFTEASVRRSYEAGRTSSDILGFLETHSAKGVPQALTYLVNDVGRRFGQLRVTAISCCVRSADPALLAEVVASRPAKRLGLRLLAPTVAAATAEAPTVLAALRDAGYLPAQEGPDGTLVLSRPVPRRAVPERSLANLAKRRPGASAGFGPAAAAGKPPSSAKRPIPTNPGSAGATPAIADARSPAAIAARLVPTGAAAERSPKRPEPAVAATQAPADVRPPTPAPAREATASLFDAGTTSARPATIARGPVAVAGLLRRAQADDWPVRLAYTSKKGRTTQLTGYPLEVGGRDVLFELLTGQNRVLSLSRIGWARVLTEAEEDSLL